MKQSRILLAAAGMAAFLSGCFEDKVAGGSSEVDNPIIVAFVDSLGVSVTTTGSLSIYLSGQNPALDPNALLTKQVNNASSIQLTASDFTQGLDSTRSYNLLLIGSSDSVGALLQNLTYQPSKRRFLLDSVTVATVKVPVVPLVRYEASLNASGDTGLVRVFIPGTPFQSVVVDSTFIIEGVPAGDFTLHAIVGDGSERPLKPSPANPAPGNHHEIDTAVPPIVRPSPAPPTQNLRVFAGNDISLIAAAGGPTTSSLFGSVQGVDPLDARLAVLWKQVSGPQNTKAGIENPTSLNTRVSFPRGGAYTFVLSAVFGNQRVEDTLLVGIQAPQEQTVFLEPTSGDTVFVPFPNTSPYSYPPQRISWMGHKRDTLVLSISYDGGATWGVMPLFPFDSKKGPNTFDWFPQGDTAGNVRLRFRKLTGDTVATSASFQMRFRPPALMKSRSERKEEVQGNATAILKGGYEDEASGTLSWQRPRPKQWK